MFAPRLGSRNAPADLRAVPQNFVHSNEKDWQTARSGVITAAVGDVFAPRRPADGGVCPPRVGPARWGFVAPTGGVGLDFVRQRGYGRRRWLEYPGREKTQ